MAFGAGLEQEDEAISEINMTPLVDVMLVLLIVFMITIPVLTHSVAVDLPTADNKPNQLEPETIALSITEHGEIFWHEQKLTLAQLQLRLEQAALEDPQPEVQIRGDRKVAYGNVVEVMAAVQQAGIVHLGFITQPKK